MCCRCSTTNPLVRPTGNACVSCKQPLEVSFVSFGEWNTTTYPLCTPYHFVAVCITNNHTTMPLSILEPLPVVEFALEQGIRLEL